MEESHAESFLKGKVILFDKDIEWTSFDVVNKLRFSLKNELGIKKIKVGHTGTLDPLATGLVIICTGKATKSIESFMGLEKEYVAIITLGGTTPSYDLESEIDQTYPYEHVTRDLLESALQHFSGEIEQAPPIFSAKQIDGKRAYNLARQGEEVILKKNLITIHEIEILKFQAPDITLRIRCSKGTYIRSIAHDLGKKLDSGAHLSALRRTKIGEYHVKDAEKIVDYVNKLKSL